MRPIDLATLDVARDAELSGDLPLAEQIRAQVEVYFEHRHHARTNDWVENVSADLLLEWVRRRTLLSAFRLADGRNIILGERTHQPLWDTVVTSEANVMTSPIGTLTNAGGARVYPTYGRFLVRNSAGRRQQARRRKQKRGY